MVKKVCIYRDNQFVLLPLPQYLEEYCNQPPEGWSDIINWINKVFVATVESDYVDLAKEIQVEHFDIKIIKNAYEILKEDKYVFDDDILKFISFLSGTTYFDKIGNPTIEIWLEAYDINHPFINKIESGFSFIDAVQLEYGQNAIRKALMSTLHWISSQGGS